MRAHGRILLLVFATLFPRGASGAVFHVDGDNPAPGVGTEANPYQTIPEGLQAATQYDKVVVHKCNGLVNGSAVGPLEWGHYLLSSSLIVEQDETLELEAGVVIKFKLYMNDSTNPSIIVNGCLRVLGQDADRIYFTSERDNTVGASDYVGSAPARGDWYHIVFNDGSDDARCLIEHAEIRYAGKYWWDNWPFGWASRSEEAILMNSASPTIRDTVIRNTWGDALECNLTSSPTIQRMTFQYNIVNGLNMLGGTINDTRIWSNTDVVYYLDSTVNVAQGTGSLTLPAGLVVKFHRYTDGDQNISLIVDGCLKVLGTSDQPVILTSIRDDTAQVADGTDGDTDNNGPSNGSRGDWYHLVFNDSSDDARCLIEHAEVRYAGRYRWDNWPYGMASRSEEAILMDSASPTITDTKFDKCWGYPVEMDLNSFPSLHRLEAEGMDTQDISAVHILGGTMAAGGNWSNPGIPYYLDASVSVAAGNMLTIEPGAVLKFNVLSNIGLYFDGSKLNLSEIEPDPIIFTSIRDDDVCGDTNNDGPSDGHPGDWGQVKLSNIGGSDVVIGHVVFRYAGSGSGSSDILALGLNFSQANIMNCTFEQCLGACIEVDNISLANISNLLSNSNRTGIYVSGQSEAAISGWTSYRDQAALIVSDAYADLWNSILSYYSPVPGGYGVYVDNGGSLNMSYNNVWSPWGTVYYPVEDDPTGSNGNISLNPRFMDIYAGDLHLQTGSPCIDAGDNSLVLFDENDMDQDGDMSEPIPWDLDGNFRFFDDPGTIDTGIGDPPITDMGAYEYYEGMGICGDINHPYLRSDLTHDCYVNLSDFAIFAIQWLDCTAPECD